MDNPHLSSLKAELKLLSSIFHEKHERFQFSSQHADEFDSRFIISHEKRYEFKANILDNYPHTAAVWFTEVDEPTVIELLDSLDNMEETTITSQVKTVITELCRVHSLSPPAEIEELTIPEIPDDVETAESSSEGEEEEEEFMAADDFEMETKAKEVSEGEAEKKAVDTGSDLDPELQEILQKCSQRQAEENPRGSRSSSVIASSRLHRELMNIWRSEPFKKKHYTVELLEDSLYDWHVRLLLPSIDPESNLHSDLEKLFKQTGKEGVLLHIHFKDGYPLEPPMVRVVEPVIKKGHVFEVGGVMCMELLLKQGWSAAYTVEAVILQVAATLVRGGGRVAFGASKTEYTLQKALSGLRQLKSMGNDAWTSKHSDG